MDGLCNWYMQEHNTGSIWKSSASKKKGERTWMFSLVIREAWEELQKKTDEGKQRVYEARKSNLYIAQIKQKHGIIERENYNKPKSEKGGQPECPKEKEIAIEEALKYFQVIPSEA